MHSGETESRRRYRRLIDISGSVDQRTSGKVLVSAPRICIDIHFYLTCENFPRLLTFTVIGDINNAASVFLLTIQL
jgi:hypothetical protein